MDFAVEELVGNGQVTGIRGREKGAPVVTEQAPLVIGADGKHSLVASAVQAGTYHTKPPQSIAFYTYWADVPADGHACGAAGPASTSGPETASGLGIGPVTQRQREVHLNADITVDNPGGAI